MNGLIEGVFVDGPVAREMVRDTYNALLTSKNISRSADSIAYTEDFERLYQRVSAHIPLTRNEVFTLLMNTRKRKGELASVRGSD